MEKNEVRVKGRINPQKLVEFINRRGGRHAQILNHNQNTNKNKDKDDAAAASTCHDQLRINVYAPQLFSDENPNSCSLM